MTIFGITGGSGSGKTLTSAIFSELGVHVIDTDVIAHTIVEKGMPCLDELTQYFGLEILNADGTLNRKKLASLAFADDKNRTELSRITHKYIKQLVIDDIRNSNSDMIAIDGAVIIGSIIEPLCDFVVSVMADRQLRIERIKKRDAITDEQANQRLDAQPDDDFYKKNSKYIIYNNGNTDELKHQICMLYSEIKEV